MKITLHLYDQAELDVAVNEDDFLTVLANIEREIVYPGQILRVRTVQGDYASVSTSNVLCIAWFPPE